LQEAGADVAGEKRGEPVGRNQQFRPK
jgi:hypothetical protein